MEIFINKGASDNNFVKELISSLQAEDNYTLLYKDVIGHPLAFYVIDNENKTVNAESNIRKDRQLSHYLIVKDKISQKEALKMIRNEIFTRANSGKPEWSLVDFEAFEPMVRVLEAGALKYDRDNWRKGNLDKKELLKLWDSFFRHTNAIKKGIETNDPEQIYDKDLGINHIGNAMCNLMFLSYHLIENGNQEIFKPNK